jgi:hypothetical protein
MYVKMSGYRVVGECQSALSKAANDTHQKTWCCIQKLCSNSDEGQYLEDGSFDRHVGGEEEAEHLPHVLGGQEREGVLVPQDVAQRPQQRLLRGKQSC